MTKSKSILIGAGFSAPIGYPIGNKLNDLLVNCKGDDFAFHTSGKLTISSDGKKPNFGYKTSYDISFDFCIALIQLFNTRKGYFDYEKFYDFILDEAHKDEEVKEVAKPFVGQFGTVDQLLFSLKNIYNMVVAHYIKDNDEKKWYDDEPYMSGPILPGYSGFLNSLKTLHADIDVVNVHTLNHDMFFERLNATEWIAGELCDGFEELGSPYFGQLLVKGREYNCRLARYTGQYTRKYRLYKLHGSFDYGVYYKMNGATAVPETYIKSRWGIGFSKLLKETVDEKGNLYYENCLVNYHADFLTGTTSKIERYKEPLLYKRLFQMFRENLNQTESLTVIGYGCKDSEVNKMIIENFDHKTKPSFIIDPFPSNTVKEFRNSIGAKLIEKHLEDITIEDF
ncbi:hypothetical protein [uncultured Roseivirga sp.]|uniref:hypothetical protein n=1 Tax=uncultured Roseivirga sp. TaxID=543088 RepID=UPI000D7A2B1D|nr:hypothetical protein [uncultured Roseivirga sp.]PWL29120.1 MAG: hypothetical protein DCO95_11815 [Roseivirga sp. XM-24bin3]